VVDLAVETSVRRKLLGDQHAHDRAADTFEAVAAVAAVEPLAAGAAAAAEAEAAVAAVAAVAPRRL